MEMSYFYSSHDRNNVFLFRETNNFSIDLKQLLNKSSELFVSFIFVFYHGRSLDLMKVLEVIGHERMKDKFILIHIELRIRIG